MMVEHRRPSRVIIKFVAAQRIITNMKISPDFRQIETVIPIFAY